MITFWYPVEERSVRIAFVLASATAAGAFGGCIACECYDPITIFRTDTSDLDGVGHINGAAGLEGFRWLVSLTPFLRVFALIFQVLCVHKRRQANKPLVHHRRPDHGLLHSSDPFLPA